MSLLEILVIVAILGAAYLWFKRKGKGGTATNAASPKGLPADFKAVHLYKNLALDTEAGRLWARDEKGTNILLEKGELLGAEVLSRSGKNALTGMEGHYKTRLLIKCRKLDTPVITVLFNASSDNTIMGGNKNYEDAVTWQARVEAFART